MFAIIRGFLAFFYIILGIRWYIRMHFHRKWFPIFWAITIWMCYDLYYYKAPPPLPSQKNKSGYQIFMENNPQVK